ncbi:hypothetical protein [Aliarcobacter butzleri]|uniref:hypothetical protein n=1 Tax=Aliarcobacter butzleri TaxID=28197 RepID=UPI00264A4572|nr:hypothetical protein [Aliarcobacter butzleri]
MTILQKTNEFIFNLIEKDPFKTISAFSLIIGSIFLLIYFFNVNYFPTDININDLLLITILSCFVGIMFISIVILGLSFPVINYQNSKELKRFEKILNYRYSKYEKIKKNSINKILKNPKTLLLYSPLCIFIILSIIFISLQIFFKINPYIVILLPIILSLFISSFIFKLPFKIVYFKNSWSLYFKSKIFYSYLFTIFISIFLMWFSFLLSYSILSNSSDLKSDFLLLILYNISFMLSFIIVNIISNKISERIIMNLIVFFGFLMITKTLYLIPYFTLKSFNLAQVNINQIVIDKKACQMIDPNSNKDYCVIKDVKLVWKVGNMYVFDKSLDKDYESYKRYEIPKSSILSIEEIFTDEKKRKTKTE